MIFEPTTIDGAFLVRLERSEDARGFFARTWCREEFAAHGIQGRLDQTSLSNSRVAGTLRGMHFVWPPAREGKLVRCERGRVHDVIVDIRPHSRTFLRHFAATLDDDARDALYVPPFVAHGIQALVDDCDVLYMTSGAFRSELYDGLRHDDPAFSIRWPLPVTLIAERDRTYPLFDRAAHTARYAACSSSEAAA